MSGDKYIAFDVHQATTVTSVLNAAGRELDGSIIATKAQPILSYLEGFSGPLHVTWEEGTYAAWLYDLLEGRVAERVVCDPRHNALLKEGSKTDRNDARKLADLLRTGMLRPVYHGSRSVRNLQEMAHSYQALVKDTTRVMNRIKAFYRSRGIDCAGRGVYSPKQRGVWLERLPAGASRMRGELLARPTGAATPPAPQGAARAAGGKPQASGGGASARHPGFGTSAGGLADRRPADSSPLSHPAAVVDLRRSGVDSTGQQ